MGYPYGKKGYKLLDLQRKKIFVSMDVKFHENIYSFSTYSSDPNQFSSTPIFSPSDSQDVTEPPKFDKVSDSQPSLSP